MGMFDSIYAKCPECKTPLEFQSKSGPCLLKKYRAESVPASVAVDAIGDRVKCRCGKTVKLMGQLQRVTLTAVVDYEAELPVEEIDPEDFLGG